MRKNHSSLRRITFMIAFLLTIFQQNLFAQQPSHVIDGTISNEKGEPLEGVVVNVKNSDESVATNASGKFSISVNKPKATLVISHVGYLEKEVEVTQSSSNLNIVLSINTRELGEVVVVGYGTVKRSDVTGAISGISQKEIQSRPVDNALQAMQGKVAGVDITSNERPGTVGDITIRGV